MIVYVVRHGESEGNIGHFHQHDQTPLSKHGVQQAKQVGRRFQHVHLSRIISSPTKRTRQTTAEITALNPVPVTYDARLKEITRPSELHDLQHRDPFARKIMKQINAHTFDKQWHYSDEDNTFDFLRRVSEGFHDLEKYYGEPAIAVVAHGHVARAILGMVLLDNNFSVEIFDTFVTGKVATNNTGITMLKFTPENKWQLIAYNDHAHLLE